MDQFPAGNARLIREMNRRIEMKKIIVFIMVCLLLTGCGSGKQDQEDTGKNTEAQDGSEEEAKDEARDINKETAGFKFESNGVSIYMNTDSAPVVEALGEPLEYFEAESCAFKGLDKFYTYNGFELSTYPLDGVDYISSVNFMDDSISTTEGIYLGSTVEDMTAAYGSGYTEEAGSYTYTKDDSQLTFITKDGEIIAITYLAVVEELQ